LTAPAFNGLFVGGVHRKTARSVETHKRDRESCGLSGNVSAPGDGLSQSLGATAQGILLPLCR